MTHTADILMPDKKTGQQHMPFWGDSMTALIDKVGTIYLERRGSGYGLYRKSRETGKNAFNISFLANYAISILYKNTGMLKRADWMKYVAKYLALRQENNKKAKQLNISLSPDSLINIPAIGPVIEKAHEWDKKVYLKRRGVYNAPLIIVVALLFTAEFLEDPSNSDC